jgi:hypothetical protein
LFNVAKPDLLSIENEEAQAEYHKGTVQDYLNELNAAQPLLHMLTMYLSATAAQPKV